jgi:hypothetical protein
VVESTQILGVLTADSERQLVINFMGGACDVSARGYADEAGSAIVVHVLVTRRQAACPAVGYLRTVVAQLAGSWGEQHIVDSQGASVPTIDGALLLTPGWLPDGYQGGAANVGATDGNTTAAQTWAPPEVDTTSAAAVACPPQAAGVELIQGYGVTPHYALLPGSHVLANGSTVRADRDEQQNVGLYWTPPHHPAGWTAALYSSSRCSGDTPVPLETLMTIANSLR